MTDTWYAPGGEPPNKPISPMGWVRVALRGASVGTLVFGGLGVLLMCRIVERPVFGAHRPVTPHITRIVCRNSLRLLGLSYRVTGQPLREPGAMVANHASWLDIFSLNAPSSVYFVSKSEVASWPGIGWLARATGTVFIRRTRSDARSQTDLFAARLQAGHRLLFFPEGTSTDGLQVLPFKTPLFQSFLSPALKDQMNIQAVSVWYQAPSGEDAQFYGWWGDMEFGAHLLQTLAARRQGGVTLKYHPPLRVSDYSDRKALARALEAQVRDGHDALKA